MHIYAVIRPEYNNEEDVGMKKCKTLRFERKKRKRSLIGQIKSMKIEKEKKRNK